MDSKIKNVVFDLGGVLINLDFDNCLNAFRKAGFRDIEKQACQFRGKGFFSQFELGEISPEEFRKAIRKEVSEALSDHEIDDMWNLMLLSSFAHKCLFPVWPCAFQKTEKYLQKSHLHGIPDNRTFAHRHNPNVSGWYY